MKAACLTASGERWTKPSRRARPRCRASTFPISTARPSRPRPAKLPPVCASLGLAATHGSKSQSQDRFPAGSVGKALAVGRDFALRVTGANRPEGRRYCAEFSAWIEAHGFAGMQKSVRSVAIELAENIAAIEQWRSTLPERQRRRLVHPLSNVRRWRASTQGNGRCPADLKRDAKAAWARFCACAKALPADEARPLWQSVVAEATIHTSWHSYTEGSSSRPAAGSGQKKVTCGRPWCFGTHPLEVANRRISSTIVPVTLTGAKCEK